MVVLLMFISFLIIGRRLLESLQSIYMLFLSFSKLSGSDQKEHKSFVALPWRKLGPDGSLTPPSNVTLLLNVSFIPHPHIGISQTSILWYYKGGKIMYTLLFLPQLLVIEWLGDWINWWWSLLINETVFLISK